MQIFDHIRSDHDRLRELLAAIVATRSDVDRRRVLWKTLIAEVEAHEGAEERTLYAKLIARARSRATARAGIHAHAEIDTAIERLRRTEMASAAWLVRFDELKLLLERNMDEEEYELFRAARRLIPIDQAERLGREFRRVRPETAPTTIAA